MDEDSFANGLFACLLLPEGLMKIEDSDKTDLIMRNTILIVAVLLLKRTIFYSY